MPRRRGPVRPVVVRTVGSGVLTWDPRSRRCSGRSAAGCWPRSSGGSATSTWPRRSPPRRSRRRWCAGRSTAYRPKPGAWLLTTARRKAVDRLRRDQVYAARLAVLQVEADRAAPRRRRTDDGLPDERSELFFTCTHPALAAEDRGALTLRCLAGLTTPEVARAFLVPTATMAQRIVRAKKKIREARIPFRVPGADELPDAAARCAPGIYSIFTEGYAASSGPYLQRLDLAEEAIRLARILHRLLPPSGRSPACSP